MTLYLRNIVILSDVYETCIFVRSRVIEKFSIMIFDNEYVIDNPEL
jgi:hypothetical protein